MDEFGFRDEDGLHEVGRAEMIDWVDPFSGVDGLRGLCRCFSNPHSPPNEAILISLSE